MPKQTLIYLMLLAMITFVTACSDQQASPSGETQAVQTEQEIAQAEQPAPVEEIAEAEEPVEEIAEVEEPVEEIAEVEEPVEEIAEVEEPVEEIAEVEEPVEEIVEEPVEEIAEEPVEEPKKTILVAPLEEESEVIELNLDQIYFAYDQSELTDDAMSSLEINYEWIQENPNVTILIAGHADERGSEEYNLGLGERRAKAVLQYLILLGAEEDQFVIISYGEERPQVEGSTEEAWSKNRRVDFSEY